MSAKQIVIFLVVLRGLSAFVVLPLLWKFFGKSGILKDFWINNFFIKGVYVYDLNAFLFGLLFISSVFFGFFILNIMYRVTLNKFKKRLSERYNKTMSLFHNLGLERQFNLHLAIILFAIYTFKKMSVFYFNPSYFEHPFFYSINLSQLVSSEVVHFFLPNAFIIGSLWGILFVMQKKFSFVFIFLFFVTLAVASFLYGSRILVLQASVSLSLALMFRYSLRGLSLILPLAFTFCIIILMAYDGNLFHRVLALSMRLDVYHVMSHTDASPAVFNGNWNEYGRETGLITMNDTNTGVGFPAFWMIGASTIVLIGLCILTGILIGAFIYACTLSMDAKDLKHPILLGIISWYLIKFLTIWPEISIGPLLDFVIEVGLLCAAYISTYLLYCRLFLRAI